MPFLILGVDFGFGSFLGGLYSSEHLMMFLTFL